jgi:hypothetical protein
VPQGLLRRHKLPGRGVPLDAQKPSRHIDDITRYSSCYINFS